MSIKILHVIDHLGIGGAQTVIKNLVENTDDKKFKIFICALRTNPSSVLIKNQTINLRYGKYNPCSIFAIMKLCREYDIDILHAHLQKSIINCLLVSYLRTIPLIVHEHGAIFRKGLFFSIYKLLLKLFHRKANVIIANSQATAQELMKKTGIEGNKIKVIYNGIDFSNFDSSRKSYEQIRTELGISKTDTAIGFVGRLNKVKGVDLLIKAFALLLRKSSNYLLVLAGDGRERAKLESLAIKLGITNKVKFLGMRKDIAGLMSGFNIGVVPSRHESFGIAAVELMRMKVPIVSSGIDGLAGLIHDGETGIVTTHNNPEEICRCIERLTKNKQLYKHIAENAYVFTKQFEIGKLAKKIEAIYEQIHG